jgi:hypothetical protein
MILLFPWWSLFKHKFINLFLLKLPVMADDDLPCFQCPHSDLSCGEITCEIEGRAVHLMEKCPLGKEI